MSILNRLMPNRHFDEEVLAELWSRSLANGTPAVDQHLETCAACRARYEDFSAWAETLRLDAVTEADAAFPAERLAAQQAQIFRRLEALERPARVIVFPRASQPLTGGRTVAYRWVAAAAAAGLMIGVGLGQWMDLPHRFSTPPSETRMVTSGSQPSEVRLQTVSAISDEALLSELEASVSMHPSVDPLRAIDILTPRSRDLMDQAR